MAIDWKNPWVIGGIAVAGIVLLMVVSKGGGSTDTSAVSLEAADATNAQLAQLSTSLQGAQDSNITGLNITNSNNAAAVAISNNDLTASLGQTNAGITSSLFSFLSNSDNNATALAAASMQTGAAIANNEITTNATLQLAPELATIQANSNQALAFLNGNTAINIASLQTQAAEAGDMTAENIADSNNSAAVNKQLISSGFSLLGNIL